MLFFGLSLTFTSSGPRMIFRSLKIRNIENLWNKVSLRKTSLVTVVILLQYSFVEPPSPTLTPQTIWLLFRRLDIT